MEVLRTYLKGLPDESARKAFALACGTTIGHMRNAGYGLRKLDPATCVRVESMTRGTLRRWDLRPHDWHEIWPELVGTAGAPEKPVAVAA